MARTAARRAPAKLVAVPASGRGPVAQAAVQTRADLLRALRDRIAADIDRGVLARDLASLSKRLLDISEELDELEGAGGDDVSTAASTPDEAWSG